MNLEEIENNNIAAKSRRKIAGFPDKRWMEEIDWLIAEVKRLRELVDSVTEVVEIFHPKSQAQEAWRREWLDKARTGRE